MDSVAVASLVEAFNSQDESVRRRAAMSARRLALDPEGALSLQQESANASRLLDLTEHGLRDHFSARVDVSAGKTPSDEATSPTNTAR